MIKVERENASQQQKQGNCGIFADGGGEEKSTRSASFVGNLPAKCGGLNPMSGANVCGAPLREAVFYGGFAGNAEEVQVEADQRGGGGKGNGG